MLLLLEKICNRRTDM